MKAFLNPLLRAILLIVIGVLLVSCREQTTQWIVILTGALFFIVGLVTLLNYLIRKNRALPTGPFPLLAIGGLLFGLVLLVAAASFLRFFMYVMGAVLIIIAVFQLVAMINIHRQVRLHGSLFLAPTLALLFGIFALWNPTKAAALPLLFIGLGCIVSGLGDTIALTILGIHRTKQNRLARQAAKEAPAAATATETIIEPAAEEAAGTVIETVAEVLPETEE